MPAAAAEAGSWAVAGAAVGAELGRSLLRWMALGPGFGRNPWISMGFWRKPNEVMPHLWIEGTFMCYQES